MSEELKGAAIPGQTVEQWDWKARRAQKLRNDSESNSDTDSAEVSQHDTPPNASLIRLQQSNDSGEPSPADTPLQAAKFHTLQPVEPPAFQYQTVETIKPPLPDSETPPLGPVLHRPAHYPPALDLKHTPQPPAAMELTTISSSVNTNIDAADDNSHPFHKMAPVYLEILNTYCKKITTGKSERQQGRKITTKFKDVLGYMWRGHINFSDNPRMPHELLMPKSEWEEFAQLVDRLTLIAPVVTEALQQTLQSLLDTKNNASNDNKSKIFIDKLGTIFAHAKEYYQAELIRKQNEYIEQLALYYLDKTKPTTGDGSPTIDPRDGATQCFIDYCHRTLKGGYDAVRTNPTDEPTPYKPRGLILAELQHDLLKIRNLLEHAREKYDLHLKKLKVAINHISRKLKQGKKIGKSSTDKNWLELEYDVYNDGIIENEETLKEKEENRLKKAQYQKRAVKFAFWTAIGEMGVACIFFAYLSLPLAITLTPIFGICAFITNYYLGLVDLYDSFKTGLQNAFKKLNWKQRIFLGISFLVCAWGSVALAGNSAFANFTLNLEKIFGHSLTGKIFAIGLASIPVLFTAVTMFVISFNIIANWTKNVDKQKKAIKEYIFTNYSLPNKAREQHKARDRNNGWKADIKFGAYAILNTLKISLGVILSAIFAWLSFRTFKSSTSLLFRGLGVSAGAALGLAISATVANAIASFVFDAKNATNLGLNTYDNTYAPLTLQLDRIEPRNEVEALHSKQARYLRVVAGPAIVGNAIGNTYFFSQGATPAALVGIVPSTVAHSIIGPGYSAIGDIRKHKISRTRDGFFESQNNHEHGDIEMDTLTPASKVASTSL